MELKASELRIGNWAYLLGEFKRVSAKTIVEQAQSDVANSEYLNPIEITEEILLKCGFEEDGNLFHNQIALYKNGVGGFNYNVNYFEYDNLEEIKFLHHLQNLYFALTQTELEINL